MLVGILAGAVSRAIIIFLGAGLLSRLPGQIPLKPGQQNLLMWGGIRGAVAIALALSLSVDIPHWYMIQSMVYGVALFSLVFQNCIGVCMISVVEVGKCLGTLPA